MTNSLRHRRRAGPFVVAAIGALAMILAALGIAPAARADWALWAAGTGLVLTGAILSRGASAFALAALALFAGGAARLWLTQPLYFPAITSHLAAGANPLALALIGAQAIVTLALLWRHGARTLTLLRAAGPLRILLVLAVTAAFTVSLMGYLPRGAWAGFAKQLVLGGALHTLALANVLALILLPGPAFLTRLPGAAQLAAVAALAAGLLAWLGFQMVPHVEDELAYLFQARLFAAGQLWAAPPHPALAPGLDYYLLDQQPARWLPVTMPGWPAVLSLGVLLGMPWLVNPVLAGLAVWLAHRATLRLTGETRTAGIAALLTATSPWLLGAAGALMGHTAALVAMLAAWCLLAGPDRRIWHFLLAGAFMGYVFTNRQLDAVLVGGLTGVALLPLLRRPGGWARVLAYGAGCLAIGGLYFLYNLAVAGAPLHAPLAGYLDRLWHPGANGYGFGPGRGPAERWGDLDMAPGHSLLEGLVGISQSGTLLQIEFLGWPTGSLILALIFAIWGRHRPLDRLAWALVALVVLAHVPYWFTGSFYLGPRYWFALFPAMVLLSARGFVTLEGALGRLGLSAAPALGILALFALLVFLPWRGTTKYAVYGGTDGTFPRIARTQDFGDAIVIYDGPQDPAVALFLNRPDLPDDRPIFLDGAAALDTEAIARAFPGRPIIRWNGEGPR